MTLAPRTDLSVRGGISFSQRGGAAALDGEDAPIAQAFTIGRVRFVLTDGVGRSRYFLVGRGDDEIGRVHGDEVGRVLGGKVMLCLVITPVEIAVQVLRLFQRVGNVALDHPHAFRKLGGNQIAIRVIPDNQIGSA